MMCVPLELCSLWSHMCVIVSHAQERVCELSQRSRRQRALSQNLGVVTALPTTIVRYVSVMRRILLRHKACWNLEFPLSLSKRCVLGNQFARSERFHWLSGRVKAAVGALCGHTTVGIATSLQTFPVTSLGTRPGCA